MIVLPQLFSAADGFSSLLLSPPDFNTLTRTAVIVFSSTEVRMKAVVVEPTIDLISIYIFHVVFIRRAVHSGKSSAPSLKISLLTLRCLEFSCFDSENTYTINLLVNIFA